MAKRVRTEAERTYFRRHLGPEMMAYLTEGLGKKLIQAFKDHGLDVRLRDDYLNAYRFGNSLARLWLDRDGVGRLALSRKYVKGTELVERVRNPRRPSTGVKKPSATFELKLDDAGLDAYVDALPRISKTVEQHATPEARWEARCTVANSTGTSILVLDRQAAKGDLADEPAPGRRRRGAIRLDMVGVLTGADRGIVAAELKRERDTRIQHVATQVLKYVDMLAPSDEGLAPNIAETYERAARQLDRLGFAAPAPELVCAGMPVHGLLVLADYKRKSTLLSLAKLKAKKLGRPLHYCFVDEGSAPVLPPRSSWIPLE